MIDGFLRGLLLFFIALSALAQAPLAFFDFSSFKNSLLARLLHPPFIRRYGVCQARI
jgi:hypothetical protein